jgi:succinyl-diaminopimelate desuccinylase
LGQDGVVELTALLNAACELLAVPSTADRPDELARALDLVVDFVGAGFVVERFERDGKPSALLYREAPRPAFRAILNAHLDVVPGESEQFLPRQDGERLYARGAHDMKVSAVVLAAVFRELAPVLPFPIALQLVTDEEVGGRDGTLYQLESGVTGRFVVIGENSRLQIVTESKGLLRARLEATGRSGHSAYPWLADNALLTLMETIDQLLARYPAPAGEVWRTTVNVARIETDNRALNQVPAQAQAWLDLRYPPEDTDFNGRSAAQVAAYLAQFCRPGVEITVERVDPPHHADPYGADVQLLRRAARNQGYPAGFLRKHGSADGRFYYERGIDAVIFGIGGAGQHGPEEYADIPTITPYQAAIREFLETLDRT